MTPASMLRLHFTKPHLKYQFGCDVTRFTKNTQKTESRSQIHQIAFKVPDVENVKIVLFAVSVMLPISNLKTVSGTLLVLNCSLSAEIDQHNHKKDVGIHVALLVDSKWETTKCYSVSHGWR